MTCVTFSIDPDSAANVLIGWSDGEMFVALIITDGNPNDLSIVVQLQVCSSNKVSSCDPQLPTVATSVNTVQPRPEWHAYDVMSGTDHCRIAALVFSKRF